MRSRLITVFVLLAVLLSPMAVTRQVEASTTTDLLITGVIDGPLTGGLPKAVEFYVLNDIADLSEYGFGSANNGGGSDGEEFTFPADSATKGSYLYVATESTGFNSFFGFAPDYTSSSAASINGDDAIELFQNGVVVDVFGDINVDGTGQPWEYTDGWAYRVDGTGPDGSTFVLANWTFSGPDALDNETTNGTAASPFPAGTYSRPDMILSGVIDGPLTGGLPKAVEFYVLNDIADLSEYGFGSANNGGGSDGEEFTFPADSATKGSYLYVATESTGFNSFFGFAPDYTSSSAASINGDDAIELFQNGVVVDVFGDINVDGTGQPWEYTDGWAYRVDGTGPDGSTFVLANWTFSGPDALDGETTNDTADSPFPIGTYSPEGVVNAPVTVNCGGTLYVDQTFEDNRTVTAADADGVVVDLAITSISPWSDAITIGDTTPSAGVGEEASAQVTVGSDIEAGTFTVEVTATNNDDVPQTGTCTFDVVVNPFLTIGEVQGVVADTDVGTAHTSPYVGQYVVVQGVIYQLTQQKSGNTTYYGFHIQNTADAADGDPLSSDGIFVFIGRFSTLRVNGGGFYEPQIGDEVVLRGPVVEYFNLTELSNPYLLDVVDEDVDLDAVLPAFETAPPDDLEDANRYWERREGMRAQIPADSIVLNGRDVFTSSLDSEVWVMRGDHELAKREDLYARRSFRDPHPLDNNPSQLFDDGNGYRIIMGGLGVKGAFDDITALLAPARTYDKLTNAPIGGVYYSFGKYQIQVAEQLQLENGVDPALNNPPQAFDRQFEYSITTFNVENLYDFVDDQFDGCDFEGNSGCEGVSPPFDYVPSSDDAYQARLEEIASQIVGDLHSPDILMVQEVEDQDVCLIADGLYTCPDPGSQVNDVDGKPDALQELAVKISAQGGPDYDAAFDRDGADDRGIISAFLFRTDRVQLRPAMEDDPVLGDSPTVVYDKPGADPLPYNFDVQNPKVLNATLPDDVTGPTDGDNVFTRPPQVGFFRLWRDGIGTSVFTDLYITDNHFSSGPDNRVGQRTEQALYNARIVEALQAADPQVYVAVGGDLNVYPRPDDPFPPPDTSDQLAGLYNLGMLNLWDVLVANSPVSAYGYIYQGQSQTLDQIFVTPSWMAEFIQVNSAHINSDFPADNPDDGPRGTSDHDPLVARYSLLPTLDRLEAMLYYFESTGDILGYNTLEIMLDRLDRARKFEARGQMDAYMDQLYAFASQAQDFAPDQLKQLAADVLAQEALLLVSLP